MGPSTGLDMVLPWAGGGVGAAAGRAGPGQAGLDVGHPVHAAHQRLPGTAHQRRSGSQSTVPPARLAGRPANLQMITLGCLASELCVVHGSSAVVEIAVHGYGQRESHSRLSRS
jgi:hypothetical protein